MPTVHDALLGHIASYAANPLMSFDEKSQGLLEFVSGLDATELRSLLGDAGFIPEQYAHDSSEEKVYAKAMDILVAVALKRIGYDTAVSAERSNSADVLAIGHTHRLVLDAKAFRLSRTALNPKDYKIEALNIWRREADYACLIGPLAGFPEDSRLFSEAVRYNVTLLTFSHLQFMLEHELPSFDALTALWNIAKAVRQTAGEMPSATQYWLQVDRTFCDALGVNINEWKHARLRYFSAMLAAADREIAYFEAEKMRIGALPREMLVELALQALKLDNKIRVIRAKRQKTLRLLAIVEEAEA